MTIVEHVARVHSSAGAYTQEFLLKLRRRNYVTPKHYLDFINMYLKLLDEKIICIKAQVREERLRLTTAHLQMYLHKCQLCYQT
jgi:hypothetical protein